MNWNQLIKQILLDFRLSGNQLADLTGIKQPTINRLYNGKTLVPLPYTIDRLEKALSIKIDDSDPNNITYKEVEKPVVAKEPIISYGKRERGNNGIAAIPLGSVDDINIGQKNMNELLVYTVSEKTETELYSIGERIVFAPQEQIQNYDKIIIKLATGEIIIRTCMILDDMILVFRKKGDLVEVDKYNIPQIDCMYKVIGKIS